MHLKLVLDYVAKPQGNVWDSLNSYSEVIKEKVRHAARANLSTYEKQITNTHFKLLKL